MPLLSLPSDSIDRASGWWPNILKLMRSSLKRLRSWVHQGSLALRRKWSGLSLSTQFLIAASIILVSTMAILGAWISTRIEAGVVRNTAVSTAFYMDSLIEPHAQGLATGSKLGDGAIEAIDNVFQHTPLGRSFATIKIWSLDGTIIYSTTKSQIGQSFPSTTGVIEAAANKIVAEFDDLGEAENAEEMKFDRPLLEVYNPIHQVGTNRVIAVAEMYQFGDDLRADIRKTRWTTFLVVGASTICMLSLIFAIVRQGDNTIVAQHAVLENQIGELSELLRKNEELNLSIVAARKLTTLTNERLLRRIGADLHDGPAQLLGLSLLYFDSLEPVPPADGVPAKSCKFETVRGLLQDTLAEVRNISADIAPPELDGLSPVQVLKLAIRNHERRTGTGVVTGIMDLPAILPLDVKTCIYRFVQEGLNNAFRHAKGAETTVCARLNGQCLTVEVIDQGLGLDRAASRSTSGLGLAGLRDRVEASDGVLEIVSKPGEGTRLIALFDGITPGAISS